MKRRRILLVDDDVSVTRALALYLTENGNCDVRVENAGSRAVAAAREFRPDLIFMDVVMPDADGAALAAEIQADPILRGTPLVFLTALVSQREAQGGSTQDRRVSVPREAGRSGDRARVHRPSRQEQRLTWLDEPCARDMSANSMTDGRLEGSLNASGKFL